MKQLNRSRTFIAAAIFLMLAGLAIAAVPPFAHADAWLPASSIGGARVFHTATLLPSGSVLVTGGRDPIEAWTIAEIYDPATNEWTAAGFMSTVRQIHTATLLPDGRVLVTGGFDTIGALASGGDLRSGDERLDGNYLYGLWP